MDQDAITRERDCTASVEAADCMALILEKHPDALRALDARVRAAGPVTCAETRQRRSGAHLDVVTMHTPYAGPAAIRRVGTDSTTNDTTEERPNGHHR